MCVKRGEGMKDTRVQSLGWEDPWRKARQPTPVFLPGEFNGQKSLACYSSWDHKESDTTEHYFIYIYLDKTYLANLMIDFWFGLLHRF